MDLELTDEQEMLRDTVRGLCETHATPEAVRELEDDPVGYDDDLWQDLARMDLLGLSLPPEHGGSGMGAVETAVVFEELGRSLAPTPYLPTVVIAGGLLAAAGTDAQQQRWLPAIAAGDAVLSVAQYEPGRGDGPEGIRLEATRGDDGLRLDGVKILVPFAAAADAILTLVRGPEGVTLCLVDPRAHGAELEHTETLASDASHEMRLDDVAVPDGAVVGPPGGGWELFRSVMDDALIALAAYAAGGAARAHEMATDYAKERVQFGVPIGNFQGVAHPLADTAVENAGARTLAYEAAWVRDNKDDAGPLPAMAKDAAAMAFRRTGRVGHQTLGGVGFTREVDMQLYFRRAKQLELRWLESRSLREDIAAAELDAGEPWIGIDPGWQDVEPHPVV